jgi:hypothetical protein
MTFPLTLNISVSDPYLNEHGKLVIKFNICGEEVIREIDGTKYTYDGERWKLIEVKP